MIIMANKGYTSLDFVYIFAKIFCILTFYLSLKSGRGGHTGLVVRASDSGSGDPGSILGRVGVLFP